MSMIPRAPYPPKSYKANFVGTFRGLSSLFIFTDGPMSGSNTKDYARNTNDADVVRCERTGIYVPITETAIDGFGRRVQARYAFPNPEGADKIPTWRTR